MPRVLGAAGGEHHHVGGDRVAVGKRHDDALVGLHQREDYRLPAQGYGPLCDLAAEEGADVFVEAAQHLAAADDHGDGAAGGAEDAGELDGDVAAADDDDVCWQVRQLERLVQVIACSMPGMFGRVGQPPQATRILRQ